MTLAEVSNERLGRWATTREILRQPAIWRTHGARIQPIARDVQSWLARRHHDEVWFCGAGTSAFVGETLAAYLNRAAGPARYRAVPTTDLVSSAGNFLRPGVRPLAVLFGRSGNSPETIGALELLASHAPEADRLHITCNPDSALGRSSDKGPGEQMTIMLPPETDDQGFAMTSSYTTMLLTALTCFDPAPPGPIVDLFGRLADAGNAISRGVFPALSRKAPPRKAVFLGSGLLTGSARESALKVLELSGGKISTMWDSTLGFRHGPKAIVDSTTDVFVFVSSDPLTRAYDCDLAEELAIQFGPDRVVRLGAASAGCEWDVPTIGNDAWSSVLYVFVAQMLAATWSDRLDLNVDNPFSTGFLTRVVSGFKLHANPPPAPSLIGGIDLGGSKIETCLFDEKLDVVSRRRVPTSKASYDDLVDSVAAEVLWLEKEAGVAIPVGIGIPGLIDSTTGVSITANLPATGRRLSADLSARLNRLVPVENDCKCFALSEANDGAGRHHRTVFGLVLGTGIGGGVCVDGKLASGLNNLAGEVGHFGLPASLMAAHGLPLVACGCGRTGCYETLLAGPGMSRLAARIANRTVSPPEIVTAAAAGDEAMSHVYDVWLTVLAEMVRTIQLAIDPDCVVIGGGLSQIEGLTARLADTFTHHRIAGVRSPQFAVARFGDSSGVRGAAMLARAVRPGFMVK